MTERTHRGNGEETMNALRPIYILEDSDDDYELLQRLLVSANVNAPLERAVSGTAAIQRLIGVVLEAAPSLVFTDLTMPDGDGFEFLSWARVQPAFQDTLIVVLSSTRRCADIDRAYSLGAHFFLSKFPSAAMLAALCASAEKRELALQARIAAFRKDHEVAV